MEIKNILTEKDYSLARKSCKNNEILFLEQLLEVDNLRLMK
jgi:hypothetical protein